MKKIISVLLSLILIMGLFSVSVSADNEPEYKDYKERVLAAIYNMETEINLDEYDVLTYDVQNFIKYVFQQYPEYHYLAGIKGGTQNNNGETVTLKLGYAITKEQMLSERAFMEAETDKVINRIGKDWSDIEKALYVHDWLDVSFMYDYDLFENPGTENHDIYGFLKEKRGVCQSYAYTFMYVMRRLGINAYYVISETDNHGWNMVEIDGNWYHVDATYDDPILGQTYHYDYVGEVRHNKFLLSDSEIIADGDHDDFFIPIAYDGENYEKLEGIVCGEYTGNASWRNATTAVHKVGDYWYYLDNSKDAGGFMRTKDFKNTERLMEIGYYVEDWGIYGWQRYDGAVLDNYFSGLFEYNGHLFFNTEDEIYVYDSHHNVFNAVPIDTPDNKTYYGLNMDGKKITYLASGETLVSGVVEGSYTLGKEIVHLSTDWEIIKEATETEDGERVKFCYFCGEIVESQSIPSLSESALLGDADGNGDTNTSDLAVVKIFLANGTGEINMRADFNKDGIINTTDLASLKLKLAGVN